jgi:hypothetical protein
MDFDSNQRVYQVKKISYSNWLFLTTTGFIQVKGRDLDGKKKNYLVITDKSESPRHIICIQEIMDYLRKFTEDVETYRTAMPDIVFSCNKIKHAIEVETGTNIRDKPKMNNKISLLNERFGKNWFFFVTNRNLEKKYSKFGKTTTKRSIKFKIRQIFKGIKKQANLPPRNLYGEWSY